MARLGHIACTALGRLGLLYGLAAIPVLSHPFTTGIPPVWTCLARVDVAFPVLFGVAWFRPGRG